MMIRTRWILGLTLMAMLLGATFLAMPLVLPEIQDRMHRVRFDPVAWQVAPSDRADPVRIRMVDDLLRRQNFHGMTRQQVTTIIGQPGQAEYFRDWDMVYWLEPERGFISIDSEWLVFRLDSQQRVTDYKIVTD